VRQWKRRFEAGAVTAVSPKRAHSALSMSVRIWGADQSDDTDRGFSAARTPADQDGIGMSRENYLDVNLSRLRVLPGFLCVVF
jgi:hypothetical protein